MKTQVYLRADGNANMGLGHVHRLLALADIVRENFECHFAIRSPLPGLRELILKSCATILDLGNQSAHDELAMLMADLKGDEIIVLDGYAFTTDYQQRLKAKGNTLVCIDDLQAFHFVADVVINPSGAVDDAMYSREAYTQVLSGPAYAFLKRPFLEAARHRVVRSGSPSLLICMGGADPDNHTLATLRENVAHNFDTLYVIIGEAYRHKAELFETVKTLSQKVEILINLHPVDLAVVMKKCGVAVCSASGVSYEYASVGGELYVKQTAGNQKLFYQYLIQAGLAFPAEEYPASSDQAIAALKRQAVVFDGQSDTRVQKLFNRLDFGRNSSIRKATPNDMMKVFEWINDPELRRQSFTTEPVSWENHTQWFSRKIVDPATVLYIVEYKSLPVGQVRFDIRDDGAIISYSIDARFRGKGWGQAVLELSLHNFQRQHKSVQRIVGYVKTTNIGSTKIFQNLGFTQHETSDYPNAYKFELTVS